VTSLKQVTLVCDIIKHSTNKYAGTYFYRLFLRRYVLVLTNFRFYASNLYRIPVIAYNKYSENQLCLHFDLRKLFLAVLALSQTVFFSLVNVLWVICSSFAALCNLCGHLKLRILRDPKHGAENDVAQSYGHESRVTTSGQNDGRLEG